MTLECRKALRSSGVEIIAIMSYYALSYYVRSTVWLRLPPASWEG